MTCYPALVLTPSAVRVDGVWREADLPARGDVIDEVTDALSEKYHEPSQYVLDVRVGEVEVQEEKPPTPPATREGVVVVMDQSPAPEARGRYDGPFVLAKRRLGARFDVDVWIDGAEL